VPLTLAGWTNRRIAEAFGVREDTVRLWRSHVMRGGVAPLGPLDHVTRQLVVRTSRPKRGSDFIAQFEQLDFLRGRRPGHPVTPVVLVQDNGQIHTGRLALAAVAARAHRRSSSGCPNAPGG